MNTVSITSKTTATKTASFSLRSVISALTFPLRVLKAQEQLNKFRSTDVSALMDMGLSQADVDRATLSDFLNNPRLR